MVLESSDNGCPLQEISNALYQPNGTLNTSNPSSLSASSASFNICTATLGAPRDEER